LKKWLVLLGLMFAFAGFAYGADEQVCMKQTWKGTIGTVPVMMEFILSDPDEEDSALAGRYYYRTSLEDLILVQDDAKPDRWKEIDPEGKVSGYLTLTCNEDVLSGTWAAQDGSRTLPIKAASQPSDSYSDHRLNSLQTTSSRASIGKFHYELLEVKGFNFGEGLRLLGNGKALADINRELMKKFTSRLKDGMDCIATGRMQKGEDHGYEYEYDMSIIAWNREFVVVGESLSAYCGGMHPEVWSGGTTYNLKTGKQEEVSQWLVDKYRKVIPKDSVLGKVIFEIYRRKDVRIFSTSGASDSNVCPASIEFSGDGIWPTPTGMAFQPTAPYNREACIVDIIVLFNKLSPYLSPQGQANAKAFSGR